MIRAAAPATSANLGPGFDAAAAAFDLWNELEAEPGTFSVEIRGEGAGELPRDETHLSLRAFALLAPVEGFSFRFTNRIPLERGLGSSAAAIAAGVAAGARAAGRDLAAQDLLGLAAGLEDHLDNLGAALLGGVCVAWREPDGATHLERIADALPADAVVVVPATRTSTTASRHALPASVDLADAAANAAAALLLGAAVAGQDARLLPPALRDRLHERHRAADAPLLERVRDAQPEGMLGATLSGSGPSVLVWSERGRGEEVAAELVSLLGSAARVLHLSPAPQGAHAA